jgi:hypothetical protein
MTHISFCSLGANFRTRCGAGGKQVAAAAEYSFPSRLPQCWDAKSVATPTRTIGCDPEEQRD